jgi:protein-L-isoaspartate(D-aspartate) O-methyltransferase
MPDPYAGIRAELAGQLDIADPLVLEALRSVPRHLFLPGVSPEEAYTDEAIITKRGSDGKPVSSSSQPALMATMLDRLELAPGLRVLEIGAGTGYNAALVSYLVGPEGRVVSLDIDQDLVDQARENLKTAGYPEVDVLCADGAAGYPPLAPYDRLVATVGVSDLAPAWLDQAAKDALIMVPLDVSGTQILVTFCRYGEHWASRSAEPCGFIRMRGALADTSRIIPLGDTMHLTIPEADAVDPQALTAALAGPVTTVPVAARLSGDWPYLHLRLWLAVSEPWQCALDEYGDTPHLAGAPFRRKTWRSTFGIVSRTGLAVLRTSEDGPSAAGYGPDGAELAARLARHVADWEAAGRPGTEGLHVDAYPRSGPGQPQPGVVIGRPHTRFAIYRA